MILYNELAKIPVFNINDIINMVGNEKTAYSIIYRLMKKDLVKKIRNNIYSVVNPATGDIIANPYQIACAISSSAYISHHSAFEYYGLTNQVYYEIFVSSDNRFNNFTYNNIHYKYVASKISEGVIFAQNTIGVRLTDLERTVIDSIQDFNKIGGIEELINVLDEINFLEESKLLKYLQLYEIQGLYQKAGFLLDHYQEKMNLSDEFIQYCKAKVKKSRKYLVSNLQIDNYFNNEWNLMVPKGLFEINNYGGDIIV